MTIERQIRAHSLKVLRADRRKVRAQRIATLTPEDRDAGAPRREKAAARAAPEKR